MLTERQWQEVEAIVRKEQVQALQHMNTTRYNELGVILDHLYDAAHCTPKKKNNKHSDKSKAISRRLKEIYKERNKIYDWYKVKEEAIREYQDNELKED